MESLMPVVSLIPSQGGTEHFPGGWLILYRPSGNKPQLQSLNSETNFSWRLRKTGLSLLMVKPAEKSGSNVRCEPAHWARLISLFQTLDLSLPLIPGEMQNVNTPPSRVESECKWPLGSLVLSSFRALSWQFHSRPGRKIRPWGSN